MHGKPGIKKPVFIMKLAGPCTLVFELKAIRNARSSTQVAISGNTLLTHRPHSPYCLNGNGLFIRLPGALVGASTWLPGSNCWPWRRSSSGL